MEKLTTSTHVDKVSYYRIRKFHDRINLTLEEELIARASTKSLVIDSSTISITSKISEDRCCVDRLKVTMEANAIEPDEITRSNLDMGQQMFL